MAASKPTTIDSEECRGGFAWPLKQQVCDHLVSRVYERPKTCLCNGLISPLRVGWSKGTLGRARVEALAVADEQHASIAAVGCEAHVSRRGTSVSCFNGPATR